MPVLAGPGRLVTSRKGHCASMTPNVPPLLVSPISDRPEREARSVAMRESRQRSRARQIVPAALSLRGRCDSGGPTDPAIELDDERDGSGLAPAPPKARLPPPRNTCSGES
jgi:hypothetical protein